MISEFGGAISEERFRQAYDIAIREEYDSLTISFGRLACDTLRFRKNLNSFICFPEDVSKCECKSKNK